MRLAIINETTLTVECVTEFSEGWVTPPGTYTVEVDMGPGVGDIHDAGANTFTRTAPPEPTITIGQLLDVAIQLGTVTIDEVTKLLPIIAVDVTKDPDGSFVVSPEKFDEVIADQIARDTKPPVDILDTAVAVDTVIEAVAAVDVFLADPVVDIKL
jgi:hypothetical protein